MGWEDVVFPVFPNNILSENHVSAAVLENLECNRYLQARGEGPGRVHLANGFLECAICELQRASSPRCPFDPEAESFRIAALGTLVGLIRLENADPSGRSKIVERWWIVLGLRELTIDP